MQVNITIGLPLELLNDIQENVKGKSRNAKIRACVAKGYKVIMSSQHFNGKVQVTNPP